MCLYYYKYNIYIMLAFELQSQVAIVAGHNFKNFGTCKFQPLLRSMVEFNKEKNRQKERLII